MFKACLWWALVPVVMFGVGLLGALFGPRLIPQKQPAPAAVEAR